MVYFPTDSHIYKVLQTYTYKSGTDMNHYIRPLGFERSTERPTSAVDVLDLMTELTQRYGCEISEKSDITYRLKNTQVYYDKILDRLYTSEEAYYRDLEETGGL